MLRAASPRRRIQPVLVLPRAETPMSPLVFASLKTELLLLRQSPLPAFQRYERVVSIMRLYSSWPDSAPALMRAVEEASNGDISSVFHFRLDEIKLVASVGTPQDAVELLDSLFNKEKPINDALSALGLPLNLFKSEFVDLDALASIMHKAYLKMAVLTHPDKGGSGEAFASINAANQVLQEKLLEMLGECSGAAGGGINEDSDSEDDDSGDGTDMVLTTEAKQRQVSPQASFTASINLYNMLEVTIGGVYSDIYIVNEKAAPHGGLKRLRQYFGDARERPSKVAKVEERVEAFIKDSVVSFDVAGIDQMRDWVIFDTKQVTMSFSVNDELQFTLSMPGEAALNAVLNQTKHINVATAVKNITTQLFMDDIEPLIPPTLTVRPPPPAARSLAAPPRRRLAGS